MTYIFYKYLRTLFHPIKALETLSAGEKHFSLPEVIACSWVVVIFNALIRVIFINFVMRTFFDLYEMEESFSSALIGAPSISGNLVILAIATWDIFIFPFASFVLAEFWIFVFHFFARFMKIEGDIRLKSQNIVTVSFSSYALNLIPFLGDFFQKLMQYIFLFLGLKKEFKVSSFEAILILIAPLLFSFMFFILLALFLILALS